MTNEQIEQYQIRYRLDDYVCQRCGITATEQAHRIAKTKSNYKHYGKDIIDHNFNIVSSCHDCNSSFNIGNKPRIADRLSDYIRSNGCDKVESQDITDFLSYLSAETAWKNKEDIEVYLKSIAKGYYGKHSITAHKYNPSKAPCLVCEAQRLLDAEGV